MTGGEGSVSTDLFDGSETDTEDYEWDAFLPDPDEDSVNDDASLSADEAEELDLDDSEFDWDAALLDDPDSDVGSDADARVAAAFHRLEHSVDGSSTNGARPDGTEGEDDEVDPDEPELLLLPDSEVPAHAPEAEAEVDTEIEEPELILLPDEDEVVEQAQAEAPDNLGTLGYTEVPNSEFVTSHVEEPPVESDTPEPVFPWVGTDESLESEDKLDHVLEGDVLSEGGELNPDEGIGVGAELATNDPSTQGGELETDLAPEAVAPGWEATNETEWETTYETEWETTEPGIAAVAPEWEDTNEIEPIELTMDAEISPDSDLDADSERPSIDDEPPTAATTPLHAPAPPETESEEIHPEFEPSVDPAHAPAHARTDGAGTRRHSRVFIASVVIAGLLLAAIGAVAIVRELHHTTGTSVGNPTAPAPQAAVSPATAGLQSATNEVSAATTTALVGLAALPTVPTPAVVAPVVDPYVASLQLYQTFLSEASPPAQAQAAAAAVAAQLHSDAPFFSSIDGLPPTSLGAYLQQFTRDVARLQTALGNLQQALRAPSTP